MGTSRPNIVNINGQKRTSEIVKGPVVIKDLISNNVKLPLATIDPYIAEGPAISWFRYGNTHSGIFNTVLHNFWRCTRNTGRYRDVQIINQQC
eukprot:12491717-Ditylum_brightwellii.AAC.1